MDKKQIVISLPQVEMGRVWTFARRYLLPNPGTLMLILALLFAVPALARNAAAPAASSVTTIPYQGRLADLNGNPVTDRVNMEFRLYDVPTGGTPLWEEFWTGGNAVNVSDGLFSVMLGSINTDLAQTVQGHDTLYLGITVGTDSEMSPRVQLGSVPFSVWSLTVADDSITAEKIATGAIGSDAIADGAVGAAEIATDAVGSDEIAANAVGSGEIGANAVGSSEITSNAVGSDEIAANAVKTSEIANGAVTSPKLSLQSGQVCLNSTVNMSMPGNWESADIPGLSTTFSLSSPSKVLVWMTGLEKFSNTGDRYVIGKLDGVSQIGSLYDVQNSWGNIGGQRLINVGAGSHTLNAVAITKYDGTLQVHGSGEWKTCIYYLVLGQQ